MRNKNPASKATRHKPTPTARAVAEGGGFLIVVELGAEWPSVPAEASARRVVSQVDGESPEAFAERIVTGFEALFGRGIPLSTLALACNERTDEVVENARRKLASLALGATAKHKSGRVFLTASSRSSGRLRHALSGLARGLFDEWRTAGLEVTVDFGEEQSERGRAPFLFTARVA
jgi:hypothetical protein